MKDENDKVQKALDLVNERIQNRPASSAAINDLQLLLLIEMNRTLKEIKNGMLANEIENKQAETPTRTAVDVREEVKPGPKKHKRSIFSFIK